MVSTFGSGWIDPPLLPSCAVFCSFQCSTAPTHPKLQLSSDGRSDHRPSSSFSRLPMWRLNFKGTAVAQWQSNGQIPRTTRRREKRGGGRGPMGASAGPARRPFPAVPSVAEASKGRRGGQIRQRPSPLPGRRSTAFGSPALSCPLCLSHASLPALSPPLPLCWSLGIFPAVSRPSLILHCSSATSA